MQPFIKIRGRINDDGTFIPESIREWARLKNALLREERTVTRNGKYLVKFNTDGALMLTQENLATPRDILFRAEPIAQANPGKKPHRDSLEELAEILPYEIAARFCEPPKETFQARRKKLQRQKHNNARHSHG